jgi:hypothetical protein
MKTEIENKYNVPNALWNKWTNSSKDLYNDMRDLSDVDVIAHSNYQVDAETWDVIAHNFAVEAVSIGRRTKRDEISLWSYLTKKLKPLKDNNLTAREIFDRVTQ